MTVLAQIEVLVQHLFGANVLPGWLRVLIIDRPGEIRPSHIARITQLYRIPKYLLKGGAVRG